MTSINKIKIKLMLIITLIISGIAFSAFSISKNTQVTEANNKPLISTYQRKINREINMLIPGHKHFNHRFINKILTDSNANLEVV